MEIRFRLVLPGEPTGTIDLSRLEAFAKTFRAATLRSAQAALSIPTYRHSLGEEARPEYRLVDLTDGSTTLVLSGTDDRPLTREAVVRHLNAVDHHNRTGVWPPYVYPGELQAWGSVYTSLMRRVATAEAEVTVDGVTNRITQHAVEALSKEPLRPMYREVILIGQLHLIDSAEDHRRFQIATTDADLTFDLVEPIETIDPFRWKRVRAHALWEVGTRRGRLLEGLQVSEKPMSIQVIRELEAPDWVVAMLQRIDAFTQLESGWNGPGSRRVTASRIEAAQELMRRLYERYPDAIPEGAIPSFVPTSAGGIEFDWEVGDRFLNVELVEGGYELAAVDGENPLYEGRATQQQVFAWIEWLLTGEAPPSMAA